MVDFHRGCTLIWTCHGLRTASFYHTWHHRGGMVHVLELCCGVWGQVIYGGTSL
jgi:hypothetical protein